MHAVLIPFGTAGDIHPFIGVAVVLRRRGHRVTVLTDSAYEDVIRSNDLEFSCLYRPDEYAELLRHPDLWHPTRCYPLIFNEMVAPKIRPVFEFINSTYVRGQTVVIAANLALGARVAYEKLHFPFVSLYVSPMSLPSYLHPPPFPGLDFFPGRPHAWLKLLFSIGHWRVDRILGPTLNALCREQDVKPAVRIMDWWHSPELVVGLFPEWFAHREAEWPVHTQLTGFPLYDTADSTNLPADLETFLQSGSAPVVFVPSSYMAQAGEFLRESVEACRRLHCRGVLLTQFPEQVPETLPNSIRSFRFAPLSRLLPRSAAIVHQAGIGTIALALAAGIPQLAVPLGMDQHANAERLLSLGTGKVMKLKNYRADLVAAQIQQLKADESIRAACLRASQRFVGLRPTEDACDLIEAVFKNQS